ncbi:MAG TPA: ATP-binding protein [Candidatus Paceibacterota bacterium]|jgi:signal transduction histidine kinase
MFTVTSSAAFLSTLFVVGAAVLLLRHRYTALHAALGYYMLAAGVWIGGNVLADISYTETALRLTSGIAFMGGAATLFYFLYLVDVLIDGEPPSWRRITLYALPNIAVSLFAFSSLAISGMSFPEGAPAQIVPGPIYSVSFFLLFAGFAYGAVRLFRAYRYTDSLERKMQLLYSLVGLLIMLLGEIVFDVVLPLMGELRFYSVGPMASVAFIVGCGYSILRHKLINLRLVVKMLEAKVDERTREIRALQEEQRRMIVDLSHNLQTPLAILKSKIDRLRRTVAHDTELAALEQSVDSLSTFIYDLMELATLEQSLKKEGRARVSLSALLEELAEEVSVIADSADIKVEGDITPGVMVVGNEKRLREALMNLASNAVKYMREDGVKEIGFRLRVEDHTAHVTITDTGIGIAAEDLSHIFERFYRGSTKYGTSGTGLGLSIVKSIVVDHGGTITAESEAGAGTTFSLTFPLAPVHSQTNPR